MFYILFNGPPELVKLLRGKQLIRLGERYAVFGRKPLIPSRDLRFYILNSGRILPLEVFNVVVPLIKQGFLKNPHSVGPVLIIPHLPGHRLRVCAKPAPVQKPLGRGRFPLSAFRAVQARQQGRRPTGA